MDREDVVVCSPIRTPVGRYGGMLRELDAAELATAAITGLLERSGLEPETVTDVILGQCYPNGEAPALGRVAALQAGLPETVPGWQLDRRCGSGLQALCTAAMQVRDGVSDVVIAGGAESMSNAEFYSLQSRFEPDDGAEREWLDRLQRPRVTAGGRDHVVAGGMVETAENVARDYGITRAAQDEFALRSHQRAVAAQDAGRFDEEILPVEVAGVALAHDEHPRRATSVEKLAQLKPIMSATRPEASVTAGNACGQSDGAAVCIVTTRARADELGLAPAGRIVGWQVAGVSPALMGIGPVPATRRLLERLGFSLADMDLIELNEAFAAQVLACAQAWGFTAADHERFNVNGSGISLGHPVGATGARIVASTLHELARRDAERALVTLCIGGGQGIAAVVERVR
jgi:acetyl-CoA C-acetyltransferase